VELTYGLAWYDSIYIILLFLLLLHSTIKDLDLDFGLELLFLNLDLKIVCSRDADRQKKISSLWNVDMEKNAQDQLAW